jgi:hypothetical protein
MRALKIIFITLAILIAVGLITAAFIPTEYGVERSVIINQPKDYVFEHIKMLKFQDEWSVWNELDPNAKHEYKGTDGIVGFIASWDGNDDMGAGEQEIVAIKEGERVELELRFIRPFESTSDVFIATNAVDESKTEVVWGFKSKMNYPMNLMLLFMNLEEDIGNDFSRGLDNLKNKLEASELGMSDDI